MPLDTAGEALAADLTSLGAPPSLEHGPAYLLRESFKAAEPHAEAMGQDFYGTLFSISPETRDLFPVNMEVQRSRLLRALVHVVQMVDRPSELVPFLEQLGRDHRKFGVTAEHYEAVGTALITSIAAYAGDAWTDDVETAWIEAYAEVAEAMRYAAESERGPASWLGHIVEHERIGWDLAKITIKAEAPVPYRAGQYVSVEVPQRPRLWRYLSPANAPRADGTIDFHVRAVDSGWVSRAIVAHTKVGDTWRIGPPMGRMVVDPESDRNLLLVCGGTGLAPIRALLEDIAARDKQPPTQMFLGGRRRDDLYAFPELRSLAQRCPWFDVTPVVEDDAHDSPGTEHGTLAEVVTRYGAWPDHDVLVCGSPAMTRATVSHMMVAGTPLNQITYDPFTMD